MICPKCGEELIYGCGMEIHAERMREVLAAHTSGQNVRPLLECPNAD